MRATAVPVSPSDPVNAAILAVSEDRLQGFHDDPFREIAARCGLPEDVVIERIRAMLGAGTIRRVRQTLLTTNLAAGALVAWQLPAGRLDAAFDFMCERDPFSGHVVVRSADRDTAGAAYRLWTTLKVPQGYSLAKHVAYLAARAGAEDFRLMPARCLFALGVGHVRRRGVRPGERARVGAEARTVHVEPLSAGEWRLLAVLKRELSPEEVAPDLWRRRAADAGMSRDELVAGALALERRGLIGRFSTFLEHVKPLAGGETVTRYNALFHWAVRPGSEIAAGREVGRHFIVTHAYWREAGPEFGDVNVMAVAHGLDKDLLLAHKAAIDGHLEEAGIDAFYTNVFWGGRSEIKPSEVMPKAYVAWCHSEGIDPERMRAAPGKPLAAG